MITGKDDPESMRLLFGPPWTADIADTLKEARMSVLLDPPRGSPDYGFLARLDDRTLARNCRPATSEEQAQINQVREMQAKIRERVGAGRSPGSDVMKAILTEYGAGWDEMLPIYQLAVNTMDQGVTPPF